MFDFSIKSISMFLIEATLSLILYLYLLMYMSHFESLIIVAIFAFILDKITKKVYELIWDNKK